MTQIQLFVIVMALALGGLAGTHVVKYVNLISAHKVLKKEFDSYRTIVTKVSAIDEDASTAEKKNKEIADAIPPATRTDCVIFDSDFMRQLGRIQ